MHPKALSKWFYRGLMAQAKMQQRILPLLLAGVSNGLMFLLPGCSSTPPVVAPAKDAQQEERFLLLQEKVREKESEIGRLSAAVEALKARVDFSQGGNPESSTAHLERKIERVKLSPIPQAKIAAVAEDDDSIGAEESVSLADSRHESLHWYFRGLTLVELGQFEPAVESFQAFLKASPHHVYADRAQFWIGESHFRAKDYGLALIELNRLVSEFPLSFRAPEASWKRALVLENLGRPIEAIGHLRDFLSRFPRHPIAPQASSKLASLEMSLAKAKP